MVPPFVGITTPPGGGSRIRFDTLLSRQPNALGERRGRRDPLNRWLDLKSRQTYPLFFLARHVKVSNYVCFARANC